MGNPPRYRYVKFFGLFMIFCGSFFIYSYLTYDELKAENYIKIEGEYENLRTRRVARGYKAGYYTQLLLSLQNYPENEFIISTRKSRIKEIEQILSAQNEPILITLSVSENEKLDRWLVSAFCYFSVNEIVLRTVEDCIASNKRQHKEDPYIFTIFLIIGIISLIIDKKIQKPYSKNTNKLGKLREI